MSKSVTQQQLDAEYALVDLHPDDAERRRSADKRAQAYGLERSDGATKEKVAPVDRTEPPKGRRGKPSEKA